MNVKFDENFKSIIIFCKTNSVKEEFGAVEIQNDVVKHNSVKGIDKDTIERIAVTLYRFMKTSGTIFDETTGFKIWAVDREIAPEKTKLNSITINESGMVSWILIYVGIEKDQELWRQCQ